MAGINPLPNLRGRSHLDLGLGGTIVYGEGNRYKGGGLRFGSRISAYRGGRRRLQTVWRRSLYERAPEALFPAQINCLERRYPAREPGNPRRIAEREREPSRSRRSRLFRDRAVHRIAGARPPTQADRKDRRGAGTA